ncbi:adenylate kinase [Eubacteriales bacterium OttesenSCG-928-G02]|nr:adenylate kinase [Eubacteriales bacterium OttesenSCG-928-G02]
MKIIFFGPPGAGKGTQAEIISKKLNIPTISTGVILRESIKNGSALGLEAKTFIEEGKLVPDSIVIKIIEERLRENDCANGFILDGFPRTVSQAEALEEQGIKIDVVLSLEVEDDTIVTRMTGRRSCPSCGATFHIAYNPSEKGEACDKCGANLTIRKDDSPEVVLNRLETYHKETEPLKDFYGKKGIVKTVIGQEELSQTTKLTLEALGIND